MVKKILKFIISCVLSFAFLSICIYANPKQHEIHSETIYYDGDPCPNVIAGIPCTGTLIADVVNYPCCNEDPVTTTLQCYTCGFTISVTYYPPAHHYVLSSESYPATCTSDGKNIYYCDNLCYVSVCNHKKEEIIKGGHKYIVTTVGATCTEDGYIKHTCSICNHEETEILTALGHDISTSITKQPTCTEDGEQSGICSHCGEEVKEVIPATGHSFSKEWTIEKESSSFTKGLKKRTCEICGLTQTEDIPSDYSPVVIAACAAAGVSTLSLGLFLIKKAAAKKVVEKTAETVVEEVVESQLLKPSFEEKTIVTCIKEEPFYKAMKVQKYLSIKECEYDELKETIKDEEPDLTIIDTSDYKLSKVMALIRSIQKDNEDVKFSLLVSDEQMKKQSKYLEQMKENKKICNYSLASEKCYVNLVKIVLPVMKPKLSSDEGLDNIGMVADALNIPFVSHVLGIYKSGRDIKETLEDAEDGLEFTDKATIISDIASILGLNTIASVSGLVGDIDDIKSSFEAKLGGNEAMTTKDAIEDIVDVVTDVLNK